MQATEDLLNVHFGHPVRSTIQAVIVQIEPQGKHYIPYILRDAFNLFGITQYKGVLAHGGLFRCGKMVVLEGIL